jgi:hypothetical protein
MRFQTWLVAIAALAAAAALSAPAEAQLVCQKSSAHGKLNFKLRETCKTNEIEAQDLGTQPSGFLQRKTSAVFLDDAGGAATTVFPDFTLPDGEWLIQAKVDVVNLLGGPSDFFRCALVVDGQPEDGSTAFLGNLQVGDLSLIAHAAGGSSVRLSCSHDGAIDNSGCPGFCAYVEGGRLSGTYLKTFSTTDLP